MKRRTFLKGVLGVVIAPSLPVVAVQPISHFGKNILYEKWITPLEMEGMFPLLRPQDKLLSDLMGPEGSGMPIIIKDKS